VKVTGEEVAYLSGAAGDDDLHDGFVLPFASFGR